MANRVVEWFTRREALRVAKAEHIPVPGAKVAIARARAVATLADGVAEAADRGDASLAPALTLYAQATYWALGAISGERKPSIAEQWDAADPTLISAAAGGTTEAAERRTELVERSFVEQAELPEQELNRVGQRTRELVRRMISAAEAKSEPLDRLRLQRLYRIGGAVALLGALILTATIAISAIVRGPDLTKGKPWRASSALPNCPLGESQQCEGQVLDIFFCTKSEASPWLEIDLQRPTTFSNVLIENRGDCCEERAVPLVLEVSDDAREFRQIARRDKTFSELSMHIPKTTARYVRVRVDKTTILHLERVAVFR